MGEINKTTAEYVAGYCTKKLLSEDPSSKDLFKDRAPEFTRMSLRPHGIGYKAVQALAEVLTTDHGAEVILDRGDVPSHIERGGKKFPLGSYLKKFLRKEVGLDEEKVKLSNKARHKAELAEFLADKKYACKETIKDLLIKEHETVAAKQKIRQHIFQPRRTIE